MRHSCAVLAVLAVLAVGLLAGCGGSSDTGGGAESPVERANAQAQREFQACMRQADELARTRGADAGSAHLDECTDNLANETLVE